MQKYDDWVIIKKRYCLLVKLHGITNIVVFAKRAYDNFQIGQKSAIVTKDLTSTMMKRDGVGKKVGRHR